MNIKYVDSVIDELMRQGISEDDAIAAALAGDWLRTLHPLCIHTGVAFRPDYQIQLHAEREILAQCARSANGYEYPIYLPGLSENLLQLAEEIGGMHHDKVGQLHAATVLVAAHEIRHRIQLERPEIRLFVPGVVPDADPLLQAIIRRVAKRVMTGKVALAAAGKSPEYIDLRTNDREFDALVIGELVFRRYAQQTVVEGIAQLILSQPPK